MARTARGTFPNLFLLVSSYFFGGWCGLVRFSGRVSAALREFTDQVYVIRHTGFALFYMFHIDINNASMH